MTYYVFVIDNSASMVQVSHTGTMVLDHAKAFIEYFFKQRSKERIPDKYDVVTCDDYPFCVIRNKESGNAFLEEIKQIRPTGSLSVETAVGRAFWILAVNRRGADNIALGRRIATDPAVVILLTDVGLNDQNFVPDKIPSSVNNFYSDVWKADQRFFTVTLKFPSRIFGAPHSTQIPEVDNGRFQQFCQTTGGCSYVVSNPRQLIATADTILSKTNCVGMRINYVYIGPELDPKHSDKSAPWKNGTVTVHAIGRESGSLEWPLPEGFWPESVADAVPSRPPVPQIQLTYSPNSAPMFKDARCRSKFEVEPSELTKFMIDRELTNKNGGCYPICVPGSSKGPGMPVGFFKVEQIVRNGPGMPVGFFKVEQIVRNGDATPKYLVILYVSTYNYLKFVDLYEQLLSQKPSFAVNSKNAMIEYLKSIPSYYLSNKSPLMVFLQPDFPFVQPLITSKPYNKMIMNNLVSFLQSNKAEYAEYNSTTLEPRDKFFIPMVDEIVVRDVILNKEYPGFSYRKEHYMGDLPDRVFIDLDPPKPPLPSQVFAHAVYISRESLFDCLTKMRVNYNLYGRDHDLHVLEGGMVGHKINLSDAEDLHSRPVKQMGEYRDYDKQREAAGYVKMREVMPTAGRAETFGNPFKQDKKVNIDEIGEEEQKPNSPAPVQKVVKDESKKISLGSFSKLRYRTYRNMSGVSSTMTSRQGSPVPFDMDALANYFDAPESPQNGASLSSNGVEHESSPSPSLVNGFVGLSLKRTVSFSSDNEDNESDSSAPPLKRRRESIGAAGGLNYSQLMEKKTEATILIKSQIRTPIEKVVENLSKLTDGLNTTDKCAIFNKALDVARKINIVRLISILEKETNRI
uniref:VWFA domain-containing protein n=1 Tax=Panagrolaimus sp. JU765 TaxID=591449 RepID=A0AC34QYE9_9BILA